MAMLRESYPDLTFMPDIGVRHPDRPSILRPPHQDTLHGVVHQLVNFLVSEWVDRNNFMVVGLGHSHLSADKSPSIAKSVEGVYTFAPCVVLDTGYMYSIQYKLRGAPPKQCAPKPGGNWREQTKTNENREKRQETENRKKQEVTIESNSREQQQELAIESNRRK